MVSRPAIGKRAAQVGEERIRKIRFQLADRSPSVIAKEGYQRAVGRLQRIGNLHGSRIALPVTRDIALPPGIQQGLRNKLSVLQDESGLQQVATLRPTVAGREQPCEPDSLLEEKIPLLRPLV